MDERTHIIHCPADAEHLQTLLEQQGLPCQVLRSAHDCRYAPACRWLAEPAEPEQTRLIQALEETVQVLHKTRHAFRSQDLGRLRQSIEQLLQDLSPREPH